MIRRSGSSVAKQHRQTRENQYFGDVTASLRRIYPEIVCPWYPFRGEGRRIYSPAIDIAVGPFAIADSYVTRYSEMLGESQQFIQLLIDAHNVNVQEEGERVTFDSVAHFNENARCLLGIEIEESGGRKHCMGDLINASALGRVGLLVARNRKILNVFLRQRVYLKFLAGVGKNTFRTDNALVLTSEQFDEILHRLAD